MKKNLVSFVIPAKNEEGSVKPFYGEIKAEVKRLKLDYEIIFIDDGSTDKTLPELKKLRARDKKVKIITHRGNWGKSAALMSGFNIVRGEIIFTMDADMQDNPRDISKFLKKLSEGYDLVSGWKKKRKDPLDKVIPSRILNGAIRLTTGVPVHDTNCGFKAYKKEVLKSLNLYGELYRYIPVLAAKKNFRVAEVEVSHRKRKYGKSKFGIERNLKGFLDLLTVIFLTRYLARPGHFFGTLGIISFTVGFAIGLFITYLRVTTGGIQFRQPLLFLGVFLMIVGVQLITTGLLAEMIVSFHQHNNPDSYIEESKLKTS